MILLQLPILAENEPTERVPGNAKVLTNEIALQALKEQEADTDEDNGVISFGTHDQNNSGKYCKSGAFFIYKIVTCKKGKTVFDCWYFLDEELQSRIPWMFKQGKL